MPRASSLRIRSEHRRGRQADGLRNLYLRLAGVGLEEVEDLEVGVVECSVILHNTAIMADILSYLPTNILLDSIYTADCSVGGTLLLAQEAERASAQPGAAVDGQGLAGDEAAWSETRNATASATSEG